MMENELANSKISKLLFKLALPSILAQLVTLLYSMVDRMYIGRLSNGSVMMAAIGIVVPLTSMLSAFIDLVGRGGAPLASIELGKKNYEKANQYISTSFVCLTAVSLLLTVIVMIFKRPILIALGATSETLPGALAYTNIYILGTFFIQLTMGLNYYINTQGFTKVGMLTVLIGTIANIILDPILIFVCHMGISGAALATVLAQVLSFIWVVRFFLSKTTILKIKKKYFKIEWNVLKQILYLGASPFFMWASEGVLNMVFNRALLAYGGTLAISSMTVMTSLYDLILLPMEGLSAGCQPILSYNYGARLNYRVKEALFLNLKVSLAYSMISVLLMELFPKFFVSFFTNDPELITMASRLLRFYIFGVCIVGANCTYQQSYVSLGDGKSSFFFAFLRKIILLIPLIMILPHLLPDALLAVVGAESIADLVTTISNTFYFRQIIKKRLA